MARKIRAIKFKDGFWGLDYDCCQGKRHRERLSRKKREAENWESRRIKENTKGTCEICKAWEKRQSLLFKDVANDYLDWEASRGKKSVDRDHYSVKSLISFFGNKAISEIRPGDIERYKIERLREVKGATVNKELSCLRRIFNICINTWELPGVDKNPVRGIKFEKEGERLSYLLPEEIEKVEELAYRRDKVRGLLIILAIRTGLRRSNLLNLKWSKIEITSNPVSIHIPEIEMKNGQSFYTYIMNPEIVEKIRALPSRLRSEYVFSNERGKPSGDIKAFLRSVLREAGILNDNPPDRLKDFTWHSLRHTFASNLVMKGIPLNTVMESGGWRSYGMVLKYAHLSPGHVQKALASFDSPGGENMSTLCPQEDIMEKGNLAGGLK